MPKSVKVELTPALVELLDEWIADQSETMSREEAAQLVLYDYFISYGLVDISDRED